LDFDGASSARLCGFGRKAFLSRSQSLFCHSEFSELDAGFFGFGVKQFLFAGQLLLFRGEYLGGRGL
jgi:hypothetical protein